LSFGLTHIDLRRLTCGHSEADINKNNFNSRAKPAGKDLSALFLKINHTIIPKEPEGTTPNIIIAFSEGAVKRYFRVLQTVQEKIQLS
jgi:hypothetical protein